MILDHTPAKDRLKYGINQARCFVFDKDASRKLGEFSVECADLVLKNHAFALPPYPQTYIEFDMNECLRATGSLTYPEQPINMVGFQYKHINGGMIISTLMTDGKEPDTAPFVYQTAFRSKESETLDGSFEAYQRTKRDLFVGQVTPENRTAVDALTPGFIDAWDYRLTSDDVTETEFRIMSKECAGGLKKALAALLLINQQHGLPRFHAVPFERRISKGKSRVFMAHSVVSIDLSPKDVRKRFEAQGDRGSPRRHEVRGHFMHFDRVEGCEHDYVAVETTQERAGEGKKIARWKCSKCGTRRVFRDSFHRGSAEIGFKTKSYEVTSSA